MKFWGSFSCFQQWNSARYYSLSPRNYCFYSYFAQEYSTENLSGTQKAMLEDLRDYGLIWQRRVCSCIFFHLLFASHFAVKPTSRRFNPTRLATTLTSSSLPLPTSTGSGSGSKEGFIVLETNYRVYAYTGIFSSSFVFTMQLLTSVLA